MGEYSGLVGVLVILSLAWICSTARRRINLRIVLVGIALQFTLAFLLIEFKPVRAGVEAIAKGDTEVKTVAGGTLKIKRDENGVTVNGAKVVKADIITGNGVIHVVDGVLLP